MHYKIAITGAAGYIGSVLTAKALELNHKVIAIDSLAAGPLGLLPVCAHPNLTMLKKDLFDITPDDLKDVRAIFHLASIVGTTACEANREEAIRVNLEGTQRLLNLAPSSLMIYTNTNIGYPKGHSDETAELTSTGTYSQTKIAAERIILSKNGISVRLASVCGMSPRMRHDLLLNFLVKECVEQEEVHVFDADSSRNFIHVKDVAELLLFHHRRIPLGEAYNLGIAEHYTKKDLLEMIQQELGRPLKIIYEEKEDPDKRDYFLSMKKWIRHSGSQPKVSVKETIRELIKYYEFRKL